MFYKPYGQTGKHISAVSCGGMRFANKDDIETKADVVRHAFASGINYFDTAPGYANSEVTFGAAFRDMPREKFYVSTKSCKAGGDELRKDMETSLQRMGIDRIDFFHIWYVTSMDAWKQRLAGGAVSAALRAKEEGLISHLAISSHMSGEDVEKVLSEAPFEGVTLGYCAINFPYRDRAVEAAGQMGLGVVTMNPLGGGVIPQHADRFDFLRGPDDASVVEAAIRFNVSNPNVTAALVGFTTKEHVDEAVAAVEDFRPYDRSHITSLRRQIISEMDELCTGCGYCLTCPEGVPIPKFMETYNLKLLGEDEQTMLSRMSAHWAITPEQAGACTLCGACEERCTQHLPIRERLAELADLKKEQ